MSLPYDPRGDKVPVRADMATIIPGPMGIAESAQMSRSAPTVSSALLSKRTQMREMLVKQLCKVHGSDAVRTAVIEREIDRSSVLRAGKLTPDGLANLERAVAEAVRATQPGPMQTHKSGRADPTKVWTAREMAAEVKAASNWTDVAKHRASYYAIEQEAKAKEHERRRVELRQKLMHQMSQEKHKAVAERQIIDAEAREVAHNLQEFHTEMAAAEAKVKAKSLAQKRDRDAQLREQAARAAAAQRLLKLEDDELTAHMKREMEAAAVKKREKERANEEYHKQTALANVQAREKREAQKQAEWAEELKLNAEWKAMLDKQEADRTGQYERLRERIKKMQRAYEYNAGAEDERRLREEEERRERYIREENERLEEQYTTKRANKKKATEDTTAYLFEQMAQKQAMGKVEREAESKYAASVRQDAANDAEKEEKKRALARARALSQMHYLNEQVSEQKQQAARDPGSSEMTALEASLNRSLLVSVVQHKHNNINPLT